MTEENYLVEILGTYAGSIASKQEFTNAKRPELIGVAERALRVTQNAALAARIQAPILFPHVELPPSETLWAEAVHWCAKPSTVPRRHLTRATSRRTKCGMVRQHLHHRTRFFVRGIAARTVRGRRSPGSRGASTSGRVSTTPVTHCGC